MVVIKLELWPGGDQSRARPLGLLTITNDGTGREGVGNYRVEASHAGKYFGRRKEPYKQGKVKGFPRTWSPYKLLAWALKSIHEV